MLLSFRFSFVLAKCGHSYLFFRKAEDCDIRHGRYAAFGLRRTNSNWNGISCPAARKRRPRAEKCCVWPPASVVVKRLLAVRFLGGRPTPCAAFLPLYFFTLLPLTAFLLFYLYDLFSHLYYIYASSGQGNLRAPAVGVGACNECAANSVDLHCARRAAHCYAVAGGCHALLPVCRGRFDSRRVKLFNVFEILPSFCFLECV